MQGPGKPAKGGQRALTAFMQRLNGPNPAALAAAAQPVHTGAYGDAGAGPSGQTGAPRAELAGAIATAAHAQKQRNAGGPAKRRRPDDDVSDVVVVEQLDRAAAGARDVAPRRTLPLCGGATSSGYETQEFE